jgi:hypothetical protein
LRDPLASAQHRPGARFSHPIRAFSPARLSASCLRVAHVRARVCRRTLLLSSSLLAAQCRATRLTCARPVYTPHRCCNAAKQQSWRTVRARFVPLPLLDGHCFRALLAQGTTACSPPFTAGTTPLTPPPLFCRCLPPGLQTVTSARLRCVCLFPGSETHSPLSSRVLCCSPPFFGYVRNSW